MPALLRAFDNAAHALIGIDLLVLPHAFVDGLPHQDLYRDERVCLVAAAGNPGIGARLTVDQLRAMPWVVTYHGPTASTPAARQMRMLGIEAHVLVASDVRARPRTPLPARPPDAGRGTVRSTV
ncbi:hypothetical protein FHX82_006484 [Amycolatopsis bartoniae]|uniref:Uncharacterized protein n=1 Tax=Amycolatopsis bartoniae TaxID=941986 RepID=A0A8H9MGR8_9PSEU|nr:hypothetical protein [Amycolatopsis bartoniae]MBB2939398.1 hypothetical protein [Amycolatopsis bartoniae]GHF83284.1 hypothetical protein GCM10017566_66680 [Amycolatopsis bartoniae]